MNKYIAFMQGYFIGFQQSNEDFNQAKPILYSGYRLIFANFEIS